MKQTESNLKKVTITYYICDVCGDKTKNPMQQCVMCNKHLCFKCVHQTYSDPVTGYDLGDYPLHYCKSCYKKSEKYNEPYRKIKAEFDKKEEEILENYRKECTGV